MSPHRWFLSLLVATLSSFAGPAWAQPAQQYVVIYVEFQPEEANHGKKLVDDLAIRSLKEAIVEELKGCSALGGDELLRQRRAKYLAMA